MIEEHDDSDGREDRNFRKEFRARIEASIVVKPRTDCPYCIPAVIAGAPGDRCHTEVRRLGMDNYSRSTHWVRVTDSTKHVWTLDAACGKTFEVYPI